eukprot:scaffold242833_cov34-Tisochrysis_lutea.AAC.4
MVARTRSGGTKREQPCGLAKQSRLKWSGVHCSFETLNIKCYSCPRDRQNELCLESCLQRRKRKACQNGKMAVTAGRKCHLPLSRRVRMRGCSPLMTWVLRRLPARRVQMILPAAHPF